MKINNNCFSGRMGTIDGGLNMSELRSYSSQGNLTGWGTGTYLSSWKARVLSPSGLEQFHPEQGGDAADHDLKQ